MQPSFVALVQEKLLHGLASGVKAWSYIGVRTRIPFVIVIAITVRWSALDMLLGEHVRQDLIGRMGVLERARERVGTILW